MNKKGKKGSNRNYIILVGLIVLFVVYQSYLRIETIGSDSRYLLTVILTPTVIGVVILGFIKRDFLTCRLKDAKGVFQKGFLIFIYLTEGFLFSYLSLGLFTSVIWDNLHKRTAALNPTEIIDCKITDFNSGTSRTNPNIYFMFRGNCERLSIDRATYGKYFDTKLADLNLQIKARKGIWNCYLIDEWKIINNR